MSTNDTREETVPSSVAAKPELSQEDRSARIAVTVFPLIIIAAFALGLIFPTHAAKLASGVNIGLGIIMFGMGLTLTLPDFALVVKRPLPVIVGVIAQYVIMPGVAFLLAKLLHLDPAIAAGVILVGCAPGGTASNVISYLAKGDVALSVTMTSISTLLAPFMTPLLTKWLAGQYMPVDAKSMALAIVQIVLIPVVAGIVVRMLAGRYVEKILPALPWISVLGISYVLAAVVGKSADKIMESALIVFVVVILHNLLGYFFGYFAGRITVQLVRPQSKLVCRTRVWRPAWQRSTSAPRPRFPAQSSRFGTTFPVHSWPCSSAVSASRADLDLTNNPALCGHEKVGDAREMLRRPLSLSAFTSGFPDEANVPLPSWSQLSPAGQVGVQLRSQRASERRRPRGCHRPRRPLSDADNPHRYCAACG